MWLTVIPFCGGGWDDGRQCLDAVGENFADDGAKVSRDRRAEDDTHPGLLFWMDRSRTPRPAG